VHLRALRDQERFDATERRTYQGRALAIVRPTGPETIRLVAGASDGAGWLLVLPGGTDRWKRVEHGVSGYEDHVLDDCLGCEQAVEGVSMGPWHRSSMQCVCSGEIQWFCIDVVDPAFPCADQGAGGVELAEVNLGRDLHRRDC